MGYFCKLATHNEEVLYCVTVIILPSCIFHSKQKNRRFFRIFLSAVFFRISRPDVFYEIDIPKYFAKFTGKHLCQNLFFNKFMH